MKTYTTNISNRQTVVCARYMHIIESRIEREKIMGIFIIVIFKDIVTINIKSIITMLLIVYRYVNSYLSAKY